MPASVTQQTQNLIQLLTQAKKYIPVEGEEANDESRTLAKTIEEVLGKGNPGGHKCWGAYCDMNCDLGEKCPRKTGAK